MGGAVYSKQWRQEFSFEGLGGSGLQKSFMGLEGTKSPRS